MAVPVHTCYQVYVLCVNATSGAVCYSCFKGICKNRNIAFLGAWMYLFSAYRITNVYVRAAVGEYTAMVFLPMVVYGFYRIYTTKQRQIRIRDYLPVVVGLTGMLHSHLITTEITVFFIFISCVILLRRTFEPYRLIALVKAALLTVLLNLGFLVPMLDSMRMDILVKSTNSGHMQESGAYLIQLLGLFMTPSGKSLEELQGICRSILDLVLRWGLVFSHGAVSKDMTGVWNKVCWSVPARSSRCSRCLPSHFRCRYFRGTALAQSARMLLRLRLLFNSRGDISRWLRCCVCLSLS